MDGQNAANKTNIYLSTSTFKSCEVCRFDFTPWYDIAKQINHYMDHGYKVLHMGSETLVDDNNQPIHSTVAVLSL
jgi:hypothetical protein